MVRVVTTALIVVLAATTLAGCGRLFSDGDSQNNGNVTGTLPDGGICTKDPVVIKNVMLAPPMCSATAPCPCGTFCSSQTGGNCIADCVDDTWCAPGYTCSPFGQCLKPAADGGTGDGGTGDGGALALDPSCPRNATLLDTIKTAPRSCGFDDACPYGSYCNHLKETCDWDCKVDSPMCTGMNTPGHTFVCGCLGKCVEVAGPPVLPTASMPVLEVTPDSYVFDRPATITTPAWGEVAFRTVTVVAIAQSVTTSGTTTTGPAATIQAIPGPGLMVKCPPATMAAATPCSVNIDTASYKLVNGVWRSAPIMLTVQPSTGAPTATAWELHLESGNLGNMPRVIKLGYTQTVPAAVTSPTWMPLTGPPDPAFTGVGTVEFSTPTGMPMRIPVKARTFPITVNGTAVSKVVLLDETRQLSPSGKLVLVEPAGAADDYSLHQVFIDANDAGNDPALEDSVKGVLLQRILNIQIRKDSLTGNLAGTFDRSVALDYPLYLGATGVPPLAFDKPTTHTFTLTKTTTGVPVCSATAPCSSGASCDLGLCSSGPNQLFYSPAGFSMISHKRMQRWILQYPGYGNYSGFAAFYAPNRYVRDLMPWWDQTAYTLKGPLGAVSGEPSANLLDYYYQPLVQNQPQIAVPLLTQHDGTYFQSASQLLRTCLTDLARDPQSSAIWPQDEAFDIGSICINLGRVAIAMGDANAFQRTLQAWLTVHSFVLREGLEELNLAAATGDAGFATGQPPPVPISQILSAGESGIGLLMDLVNQNNFGIKAQVSPYMWNTVDYRTLNQQPCSFDSSECNGSGPPLMTCDTVAQRCKVQPLDQLPQHDQPLGVPPMLLEMAGSYLKVLEAYLNQTARETYGQAGDNSPSRSRATALARFGSGMRLVLAAEQLAVAFNIMAPCPITAVTPGVPINPNCAAIDRRFNAARDEMNINRTRALSRADALANGRNPFNIPEDDVPLFFGDPVGTSSRYFASSDYLVDGWAAPAVAQAQASLDGARAAWISKTQSVVQDELNQHNRDQEINQLMSRFGAPILAACGGIQVPDNVGNVRQLDSAEVIPYYNDSSHSFANEVCFVDEGCTGLEGLEGKKALQNALATAFLNASGAFVAADIPGGFNATLAVRTAQSEVCKIKRYAYNLPSDAYVQQMTFLGCANGGAPCLVSKESDNNLYVHGGLDTTDMIPFAAFYGPIKKSDTGNNGFYKWATVGRGSVTIPGGITLPPYGTGLEDDIYSFHDLRGDQSTWPGGNFSNAQQFAMGRDACAHGMPGGTPHDYPLPNRLVFAPSCYKGALGVAFREMQTNDQRIGKAKDVLDSGQADLDDTYSLCTNIDTHAKMILDMTDEYNGMKKDYQKVSAVLGSISSGKEGFSSSGGNPYAAGAMAIVSLGMNLWGNSISDEEARLARMEKAFSLDEKSQQCWNTFHSQRRNLATAMTDVQIATSELNTQTIRYRNLQTEALLNLQEGKANLVREQKSPIGSLSHTYWVDEKVEKFRKEFEWARRLSFLAMRAVEYEFMQSLPFRSEIVAATNPDQLEDVIRGLRQEQGSRTINRRRPEEASIVLSLRDDVLGVSDKSSAPAGERNWTPAQRFASRLWDSKYAVRDSKGNWLGQGVSFNLGPTDILETRCGERVWRVAATIQGDRIDVSAPGASLLLMKRNTFSSQYCNGQGPGANDPTLTSRRMQIGTVHTTADLFQPGSAVDLTDANQFTAALLYPWFNVRRTDFYKTTYQDGASEELAGRGLYGDYTLLFPKQMLDDSFTLNRVEDVLLRLDYLSVDNLAQ